MKLVNTTEAVGHVLCHDLTRIAKEFKGVAFKKGHIVREEDIPVLLSMGKEHLYIWEKEEGTLHENEAAKILYDVCKSEYTRPTDVKEGKIEVIAAENGLLKIDIDRLKKINSLGDIIIATRHTNLSVKKGDKLAGTRVVPLIIKQEKMDKVIEIAGDKPLIEILPYKHKKVGIVTTGSEVFYGRIKDRFTLVVWNKLKEYDVEILDQKIVNDDVEKIKEAIQDFITDGAELIICTGGMSVDPDDKTPGAIKNTGAEIITYGAPVLPGAMFLLAYYNNDLPILGLPGCVMYSKTTIFDLVLPRIMVNDKITMDDLADLGHGGLCLGCEVCNYPNCGFGK